MRRATSFLVCFAVLVLVLTVTACVNIHEGSVPQEPIGIHLRWTRESEVTCTIPPALKQFPFDTDPFLLLWPQNELKSDNEVQLNVIESSDSDIVIWPFKLNGKVPPAEPGHIWVAIVSMDDVVYAGEKPRAICRSTEPNGPQLYLYQIKAKSLHTKPATKSTTM